MLKKYVPYIIILLIAPVIILAGAFLFPQKSYVAISFLLATLACIPFFISFENKNGGKPTFLYRKRMENEISTGGKI